LWKLRPLQKRNLCSLGWIIIIIIIIIMAAAAAGIKMSSWSMTSLHLMGAVLIFVVSMISLAIATEAHEPAVTDQVAN
jgi:hypothetical protein